MALINIIDPAAVADRLVLALKGHLLDAENVEVHTVTLPQSSGLSNETVLFAASWNDNGRAVNRRLVARVAPTGPSLFQSYDLALESRVIGALSTHSCVPVPEVLFYEDDSSLLGAPFIVMGHVDGQAAADDPPFTVSGWVMELAPRQRAQMADNGLKALAAPMRTAHRWTFFSKTGGPATSGRPTVAPMSRSRRVSAGLIAIGQRMSHPPSCVGVMHGSATC